MKIAVAALLALPLSATAADYRVTYQALISSMFYADCTELVNGSCRAWQNTNIQSSDFVPGATLALGMQLRATFTLDSSRPYSLSSDGYQATYLGGVTTAAVSVGEMLLPSGILPTATIGSDYAVVDNRNGYDSLYVAQWYSGPDLFATLNISMLDRTATVLNGFLLPTALSQSNFQGSSFDIGFLRRADGDQVHASGTISSFTYEAVTTVPEPTNAALLAAGLVALGVASNRKRAG